MIEETIRAVREAEARAAETVSNAGKQADALLRESEEKIRKMKSDSGERAKEAAAVRMKEAEEEGRKILSRAEEEAAEEAREIREKAAGMKDRAVDAVISCLLG